jgi:hypothetical protein
MAHRCSKRRDVGFFSLWASSIIIT